METKKPVFAATLGLLVVYSNVGCGSTAPSVTPPSERVIPIADARTHVMAGEKTVAKLRALRAIPETTHEELIRECRAAGVHFRRVLDLAPNHPEALAGLALAARLADFENESGEWIDRAIRAHPDSSRILLLRVRHHLADRCPGGEPIEHPSERPARLITAQEDLKRVLTLSSDAVELRIAAALLAYARAEYRFADEMLSAHLKSHPDDAELHAWHGHALMHLSRREDAVAAVTRAIEIDARLKVAFNLRSILHRELGDLSRAIRDSNRVIDLDPTYAPALINRAQARFLKGEREEALRDLDAAIVADASDSRAHYQRGQALVSMGRFADAVADFDSALALDPDDATVHRARGWARHRSGNDAGALEDLDRVAELRPRSAWAVLDRAELLVAQQKPDLALAAAERAPQLAPRSSLAFNARAVVKLELGRTDSALEDIEEALEIKPGTPLYVMNRGRILFALKNYERAFADFDEAVKLDPRFALAYYYRGVGRLDRKKWREAAQDLKDFVSLDPSQHHGWHWLARAHSELKDPAAAVRCYDRALEIDPRKFGTHFNRGLELRELGRLKEAEADLRTALEKAPPDWSGRAAAESELRELAAAKGREEEFVKCHAEYKRFSALYSAKKYSEAAEGFTGLAGKFPGLLVDRLATYNVARCRAKLGESEAALEWLERAAKAGYRDSARMKNDPALVSLREEKRFKEVVELLETKDPSKP